MLNEIEKKSIKKIKKNNSSQPGLTNQTSNLSHKIGMTQ
jgi:hypothetical protein